MFVFYLGADLLSIVFRYSSTSAYAINPIGSNTSSIIQHVFVSIIDNRIFKLYHTDTNNNLRIIYIGASQLTTGSI